MTRLTRHELDDFCDDLIGQKAPCDQKKSDTPLSPEDEQKEMEREKKKREIVEKKYIELPDDQFEHAGIGGMILLNLFDQWDEIRSDIRDMIIPLVCRTLAKTPRPPIELAGKLISDIHKAVGNEEIPKHPIRNSIPPNVESDAYNEKAARYAERLGTLQRLIFIICDQHDAAYQMWLMNRATNEMVQAATSIQVSDQPPTSFVPLESGIRTRKNADPEDDGDSTECKKNKAPDAQRNMYDRVRRDSGTMKRILTGSPLPADMLKDGTSDRDSEK